MVFSNSLFSTKISDVSSSVLLLTGLTISTKISDLNKKTFSNSIQLKIIKISTVIGTQEVIKNDFF